MGVEQGGEHGDEGRVGALLGPTNTGKTYLAVERMLEHASGVIGFPLRLLARENYDKLVKLAGREAVALVTGEEKIVPRSARYFACTVESMPLDRRFDFLAVDEIQHCADRERGHVFTDRLLHARGRMETLFLGADTIRPLLRELLPAVELEARPRFSVLSYGGATKLSKLPPRSAVVAFSVNEVYAIAEQLRRARGGAAVVMGALSPRTRNAQVAMYQAGEVDYLVATDAIGMGLNMDIDHVAFSSLSKFDGEDRRELVAAEIAQIAGRAGRFMKDGTFGTLVDGPVLDPDVATDVQAHRFAPLSTLVWRNSALDFTTVQDLLATLEVPAPHRALVKGRVAEDLHALHLLAASPAIQGIAVGEARVRLLWDVCQVPDFRKISAEDHTALLAELFRKLVSHGQLPSAWVQERIRALDRVDGDVEELVARIAHARTWSTVAFRAEWLDDATSARELARAVEDRLSDALHERLQLRFVDRLSSALRRRRSARSVESPLQQDGSVVVEGAALGQLKGFRFEAREGSRAQAKRLDKAAAVVLKEHIAGRTQELLEDVDGAFSLGADGVVRWRDEAVARLTRGPRPLAPDVVALSSSLLDVKDKERVAARAKAFVERRVRERLAPLFSLVDGKLDGAARGLAYQLGTSLGALPRREVQGLVDALSPEDRRRLQGRGVRLGWAHVYMPSLLKPATIEVCAALHHAQHHGHDGAAQPWPLPPPGAVSFPVEASVPAAHWFACGFVVIGAHAYRLDMLDKVAIEVRALLRDGPVIPPPSVLSWLGAPATALDEILLWCGLVPNGQGRYVAQPRAHERRAERAAPRKRRAPRAPASTLGTLGDVMRAAGQRAKGPS